MRPTITKHASCLALIGAFGLTSIHLAFFMFIGAATGVDLGTVTGADIGTETGVDFGAVAGAATGAVTGADFGIETGDDFGTTTGVDFGAIDGAFVGMMFVTILNDTVVCCPLIPVAFVRLYGVAATVCFPATNSGHGVNTPKLSRHIAYGAVFSV